MDPLASGCGPGEACYLAAVGEGMTFCEPEGSAQHLAHCANDFACQQGFACFGPPGEGVCRKVCRVNVHADCPLDEACGSLTDQWGICF